MAVLVAQGTYNHEEGPSASEFTTLWRYTNLFIIIIIIIGKDFFPLVYVPLSSLRLCQHSGLEKQWLL